MLPALRDTTCMPTPRTTLQRGRTRRGHQVESATLTADPVFNQALEFLIEKGLAGWAALQASLTAVISNPFTTRIAFAVAAAVIVYFLLIREGCQNSDWPADRRVGSIAARARIDPLPGAAPAPRSGAVPQW